MHPLVVMPTYNERENIAAILPAIRTHLPQADVLVIDDNSPDGTAGVVAGLAAKDPQIQLLQRPGKMGLGTAYIAGFRYALEHGYDCVLEMDADFSHDPAVLPQLVAAMETHDLSVGSRYIPGGSTPDWTLHRRLISGIGNLVARTVLGCPVRDLTTGYKCYRASALRAMNLDTINLKGYGFQVETTYQCYLAGLKIREIPITFIDRRVGKSKMSGSIVREALLYVFKRRWQRLRGGR